MKENIWNQYNKQDLLGLEELTDQYIDFLSKCKTERECVEEIIRLVTENGFKNLDDLIANREEIKAGDKIFAENMGKTVALFIIGEEDITKGMNILGAHIDSPRLDLKANPLYEDTSLAYFDTHYYGGIKKYQWVNLPLALHGVVVLKNGEKVTIKIGEDLNDPVVGITDLLPHLAMEQMKKEATKVIEGEKLDVLIGSRPDSKTDSDDGVKKRILSILEERYGIREEDFLSAEIEVVPAGRARNFGLDESMIMSYGQDDRVCAYTSLKAMLDVEVCSKTLSCIFVDKEEIGSVGATGMCSDFYENAVREICSLLGKDDVVTLGRVFRHSKMLSSDVNAAYDPLYDDVMEKRNCSYLNNGVVFSKYTGSRGKSSSNDANAEFIAELRQIMEDEKVHFQMSELGKVDVGGGGTIAYILANKNISVIDCGVGVLSMHAPWEITSKADVYEAYKCYKAFLKRAS